MLILAGCGAKQAPVPEERPARVAHGVKRRPVLGFPAVRKPGAVGGRLAPPPAVAGARDGSAAQRNSRQADFAVDDVFDRIRETPELCAAEHKAVRRVGLSRFPYVVYYRIVGASVEVIAVQHGSRNPRRWRSRA